MSPIKTTVLSLLFFSFCATSAKAADQVQAKLHFDNACSAFIAGGRAEALAEHEKAVKEYTRAVDEYRLSYEADPQPGTLFSLGQAYRALGELELSLHSYRQYLLEAPANGRWRDVASHQIQELETALAKKHAAQASPPRGVPSTSDDSPTAAQKSADALRLSGMPEASDRWYRSKAGWALAGSAAATAVLGGILLWRSQVYDGQSQRATSLQGLYDARGSAQNFEIGGGVVLGICAGAIIGSGLTFILARPKRASMQASISPPSMPTDAKVRSGGLK